MLRQAFPVLDRFAYLNAGTCGPIPTVSVDAARAEQDQALREGRTFPHFMRRMELMTALRAAYARRLGAEPADVALTNSTTEGVSSVLSAFAFEPGAEVLTSEEEHPGLLAPLAALRRRGVDVRMVPFAELAESVSERTTLVACSHVNWVNGSMAPAALTTLDVPVLFDAAQSVGAVTVDVVALGCAFYAGSGQKWLCGPDGTGMLWIDPAWRERLRPSGGGGYLSLAEPARGLDSPFHPDARAFDVPGLANEPLAAALAAVELLETADPAAGPALAARAAAALAERGRAVAARGDTTLVSFSSADPPGERVRLAEAGVIVRDLPGTPYLRASFGAWNDDSDLERLLAGLD